MSKPIKIGARVGTPHGDGTVTTRESFVQGRSVIADENPLCKVYGMVRWGVELDKLPNKAFPKPAYYHPDKVWNKQ